MSQTWTRLILVVLPVLALVGCGKSEDKQNGKPGLGGPDPLASVPTKKPIRAERTMSQMEAVLKEDFRKWGTALKAATGEGFAETNRLAPMLFLSDFNRLFENGKFRKAEYDLLLQRMNLVPAEEIQAFLASCEIPHPDLVTINLLTPKQSALVVLIQQDPLFAGNRFDAKLSKVLRDRLGTIPADIVRAAARYDMLGSDSAMDYSGTACALASYDRLFVDDRFQVEVWCEMVAAFQKQRPAKN